MLLFILIYIYYCVHPASEVRQVLVSVLSSNLLKKQVLQIFNQII